VGTFLESEKARYILWKASTGYLSDGARGPGEYRGREHACCLPPDYAEENLYPGIRESATGYFARHAKWHDGRGRRPSVHLCDSQVCCVNMLFPFADQPEALAELLRPHYADIDRMLAVEDGLFVGHEWIGAENYLHEVCRNGVRTRGACYTSADAIVRFRRKDGAIQVVLIEFKYGESYGGANLHYARSGTDRTRIYRWLYDREDCPLEREALAGLGFESLFYEPFYQFMRQQFLAHEMERAHELDAEIVSLLHIAPERNDQFRRVTSPALGGLGTCATGIWAGLVRPRGRFLSVSTESLFGPFPADRFPDMGPWQAYIQDRYPWVYGS